MEANMSRPKSNVTPIDPSRAWASKSGGHSTMAPREYHPKVPADTVEALLWVSAESLAADIAERKKLGTWKPANTDRRGNCGVNTRRKRDLD